MTCLHIRRVVLQSQARINFHTFLVRSAEALPLQHGRNYQCPPPELVDGEEEYEVEKILDQRHFSRRRKLQYLVKCKGYSDSENQWVNSTDVFADEAIREFQNSSPASPTHKSKHKSHQNRHLLSSLLTYMTSPSPLPIPPRNANNTPLDAGTTDYSVSRIFGMLIKPERGQILPDFLKYQDAAESPMARSDDQMEERATRASPIMNQVPVRIPSTSDIAEVRSHPDDHLAPGLPAEYSHDEYNGQFHFVPEEHACQVHAEVAQEATVAATWEAEYTHLTPYVVTDTDDHDSDKENPNPNQEDYKNAKEVSGGRQDAQGMGPRCRGHRGRKSRQSVVETEEGPIRLYHPWCYVSTNVCLT